MSRAVRDAGDRVVLSGEGGDELFAGYPNLVMALRGLDEAALEKLRSKLGMTPESLEQIRYTLGRVASAVVLETLGSSPVWFEVRHRVMKQFGAVLPTAFGSLEMDTRLLDSLDIEGQWKGRSPSNKSCYLHSRPACQALLCRH